MLLLGVSFVTFRIPSKRNPNLPLNLSLTTCSGFLATFPRISLTYMTATANVIMIIKASAEDIVSKLSFRSNRIYRERGYGPVCFLHRRDWWDLIVRVGWIERIEGLVRSSTLDAFWATALKCSRYILMMIIISLTLVRCLWLDLELSEKHRTKYRLQWIWGHSQGWQGSTWTRTRSNRNTDSTLDFHYSSSRY